MEFKITFLCNVPNCERKLIIRSDNVTSIFDALGDVLGKGWSIILRDGLTIGFCDIHADKLEKAMDEIYTGV